MKNPKDTTVLFLVIGIGMAIGLGLYWVATLTALLLDIFLWLLHRSAPTKPEKRARLLEVVAKEFEAPQAHIERVLAKNQLPYEARQISRGDQSTFRYEVILGPGILLTDLNRQIFNGGPDTILSVGWDVEKRPD